MNRECKAVSPVIGVMLMLAIVVLIAAIAGAFAGVYTSSTTSKSPISASFDCSISNDGTSGGSHFELICLSADGGIKSRDLKIVTSWTDPEGKPRGKTVTASGDEQNVITGGAGRGTAPFGYGPGIMVSGDSGDYNYNQDQYFGRYTFLTGTKAACTPFPGYGSSKRYTYEGISGFDPETGDRDSMMAVLGRDWNLLRPGDKVDVKVVHLPSGTLVYDQTVMVQ